MIEYVIAERVSYGFKTKGALWLVLTDNAEIGKDGEKSPPTQP